MSRKIYTKREDRTIYAFVSPTEKKIYINHCRSRAEKETYRHNIKGRRYASQRFFKEIKTGWPCFFVLEELPHITISKTYKRMLVWIRIFIEQGYTCYNYTKTIEQSSTPDWRCQLLYREMKDLDVEGLIACQHCLVQRYKYKDCFYKKVREDMNRFSKEFPDDIVQFTGS